MGHHVSHAAVGSITQWFVWGMFPNDLLSTEGFCRYKSDITSNKCLGHLKVFKAILYVALDNLI